MITNAVLTGLRLFETEFRVSALIPILSMGGEIAFAVMRVVRVITVERPGAENRLVRCSLRRILEDAWLARYC